MKLKGHYLIVGPLAVGKTILAELIECAINQNTKQRALVFDCYDLRAGGPATKAGLREVSKKTDILILTAETVEQFQSLCLDKIGITITRTIHLTKHD